MNRWKYLLAALAVLIVGYYVLDSNQQATQPEQSTLVSDLNKSFDSKVATWSYARDYYTGKLFFECASKGDPVIAGDPNSTHPSYYILCNMDSGVNLVYIDGDVQAFPQPMHEDNGWLIPFSR